MRRWLISSVALVVVVAVPGCSGDDDGTATSAPFAAYFDALATRNAATLRQVAQDVAAEGSPAQAYALYEAELADAAEASGQPLAAEEATPEGDGYRACAGDDCTQWTGLSEERGALQSFSVDGARLEDSLVDLSDQAPIDVEGLFTVRPRYADRAADDLTVVVEVETTDVAVEPRVGEATYLEPALTLTGATAATTVGAGTTGSVVLRFPGARDATLTGQVTLPVDAGGVPLTVGFGLAAPA